jgi:hypothetical protein
MSEQAPRETWSDLDDVILTTRMRIYENAFMPP